MAAKPKILMVEDSEISAMVTSEVLAPYFSTEHVDNGRAALEYLTGERPDLVLLDVDLPDITGYEVCRAMRGSSATCDLPVIFLSGMVSEEDLLAGYEAGGDDYLSKPVPPDQLCTKINLQMESHAERNRFKPESSDAFLVTMTAISDTAEISALLQFMRRSFSCQDYTILCREMLKTLGSMGLEAIVRIRGMQQPVFLGTNGPCSPLEKSVLENAPGNGRLFEFASLTSCSHDHINIIVKSTKRDEPECHRRMKENLGILAEGADARVAALDNAAIVAKHNHALAQLVEITGKALQGVDPQHRGQGTKRI